MLSASGNLGNRHQPPPKNVCDELPNLFEHSGEGDHEDNEGSGLSIYTFIFRSCSLEKPPWMSLMNLAGDPGGNTWGRGVGILYPKFWGEEKGNPEP